LRARATKPVNVVSVRRVDDARKVGRKKMVEQNPTESVTASKRKVSP
jgi:hypothetical protein